MTGWWRRRDNDEKQVLFVVACVFGLAFLAAGALWIATGEAAAFVVVVSLLGVLMILAGLIAAANRLFPTGKPSGRSRGAGR